MKVVFTGGGTGGHFYPIIAIAQRVNDIAVREKLSSAELYYISNAPYNESLLYEQGITFVQNTAGKRRRYVSILNFLDLFKIAWGSMTATWKLFQIYPDVVFGKGGYASFPTLFAARILGIPVIIHESDTVPGRVNKWAGKFAKRIAISYKETAKYYPEDKVALVGSPIRRELEHLPNKKEAYEHFELTEDIPVIFVIGGSQGSEIINDNLMDALPKLVENYYVIHQTGDKNAEAVAEMSRLTLQNNAHKDRYKMYPYLNTLSMRMAAGAASLIISRAGSTILEIATWGIPSILIPITDTNGDHQRQNAFAYSRIGGCSVIEEKNLTRNIIVSEVERIMNDPQLQETMKKGAAAFNKDDAAEKIAEEIVRIALSHGSQ